MAVHLGYNNVYRYAIGYPEWHARGLPVESAPAGLSPSSPEPEKHGPLYGWAMLLTLLGIFTGGMALNLTPCVYPLIPITVSYFGGQSGKAKGKLIVHGVCYIGGLSVTNTLLGVTASLTGGLMGGLLQNPIVLALVAAVLLFFATSLFGLWEIRLPSSLTRAASTSYAGYVGTLFMGLTLGVVAAPCIGPFILGLLTWVASMASPWIGFLVFFTLSIGLGLPLFFLAMFSSQIERLPRSGQWMLWVRKLMGWILVGMSVYFVRPSLSEATGIFLSAGSALAAGVHLGWLDKSVASFRVFRWLKRGAAVAGPSIATLLIGMWVVQGPGVAWETYSDHLLEEAKRLKRPVIIDFYADWCSPCRDLEKITFHNTEVVTQGKNYFVMVKVDLTRKEDPWHETILRKYGVRGVPTVLFLNPDGSERVDLRLVDYLPPDQFLDRMMELRKPGVK